MVQLPEPTGNEDFPTIADIGKSASAESSQS